MKLSYYSGTKVILTIVGSIHLITKRQSIRAIDLGTISRWMKQGLVEQIGKVTNKETLICTIWIVAANF